MDLRTQASYGPDDPYEGPQEPPEAVTEADTLPFDPEGDQEAERSKESEPETQLEVEMDDQDDQEDAKMVEMADRKITHYEEIVERTAEVRKAHAAWQSSKDSALARKKRYDELNDELLDLISKGPDLQGKLFDLTKDSETEPEDPSEDSEDSEEAWREVELSSLPGLANQRQILKAFDECEIKTMGDYAEWRGVCELSDLPGVGKKKAGIIEDVIEEFWLEWDAGNYDEHGNHIIDEEE